MPKREWRSATMAVQCPADCPFRPCLSHPVCAHPDGPEFCISDEANQDDQSYFPADCPLDVIATECPKCKGEGQAWDGVSDDPPLPEQCSGCGGLGVVEWGE